MSFWYKFLTYLFYPFAFIFLFYRKIKKKEDPLRYKEKLSKIDLPRGEGFLVWFHSASVGETLSILPLVEILEKEEKIKKILITTITYSSAEVLKKKIVKNKKTFHQFLPLDIAKFVKKFLNHWRPNLAIFVDSEIWPNLIYQLKERNTPLILLNGRLTKKTFLRWKYLKNFSKKIFKKFDLCIASNNETKNFLKELGADNIKYYGNLKFSGQRKNYQSNLDAIFLNKIKNRKIWCAASTHKSEEIFCAKSHLEIKKTYNNILTIIIPRHIGRIKSIINDLKYLNLKIKVYSKFHEIESDTDILLVDTYGETEKFFDLSSSVFLGGSLINHGGQNPIEPARLGCSIFHGPNVNNFKEIYDYLKSLGLAKQIDELEELNQSLVEEFKNYTGKNIQNMKKIEDYGENILNNVIKDLKKYI